MSHFILSVFQIYVSFGSDPVPGSPFPCKVYNVNAIQVRECKKGIVGKPVTFLVETSQAGPGNLEVTGRLGIKILTLLGKFKSWAAGCHRITWLCRLACFMYNIFTYLYMLTL